LTFLRGNRSGRRLKIGVVVSRFNEKVTDKLLQGALEGLEACGVSQRNVDVVSVPGAFEIPGAAKKLIQANKLDAVVCLGAVIKGQTEHSTFVSSAAQQGILQVSLESGVPCTFGVLTTDTVEQAIQRAGGSYGNKGYEAATDAVEMANLYKRIGS
jgi:6,7-dimethyl-8-ribityllumazine synthase